MKLSLRTQINLGLLVALLLAGSAAMPPLLLGAASSLVLVIVAAWETWSLQLQPAVDKGGDAAPSS